MSAPYPQQAVLAPASEDPDSKRSRRGRTSIGIGLLVMGAIATAATAWLYSQFIPVMELMAEDERSKEVLDAALGILQLLAIFATGIWNIATRRSWAKAPLIVAAVLSGICLVLAVINAIDIAITLRRFPVFWLALMYLALMLQSLRLLRLKPAPRVPGTLRPQPW
ncbi:hypothetical protein [Arthrobacter silvisoli]|uniref:hypothetical protein n=1 Tax=Arthrobacter silvisoli TaxID=2291022 RepID=UPI000E21A259|nr:hypothetical protein [Arthrobacter silvisoli]